MKEIKIEKDKKKITNKEKMKESSDTFKSRKNLSKEKSKCQ